MDLLESLLCDLNFGTDTASSNDSSPFISPPKSKSSEPEGSEPPCRNHNHDNNYVVNNGQARKPENHQSSQSRRRHAKAESSKNQIKRRQLFKSPPKRVYSFTELIIYQFSPLAKNIKCSFSSDAVEYNLLLVENSNDNSPNRQPGVCRSGPIPRNKNNNHNNHNNELMTSRGDSTPRDESTNNTFHNEQPTSRDNDRPKDKYYNEEKNLYIVPALRKHVPSPLDLTWINELIEAQNRWIALLMGRSLVKKAKNQLIDCKDCKNIITVHFNSKENHDDKCVSKPIVENILRGNECAS